MSIIQYTKKEAELLARLMRAEAESEGELGMLRVDKNMNKELIQIHQDVDKPYFQLSVFL